MMLDGWPILDDYAMQAYKYSIELTSGAYDREVLATEINDGVDGFVDFHDDHGLVMRLRKDRIVSVLRKSNG
jgi:hypothetical protein